MKPARKDLTYSDLLMGLLSIPTLFHQCHDDILRRHEWQLLLYPTFDYLGIHHQSFGDILQRRKDDISRKESFREGDASVGTVIDFMLTINEYRKIIAALFNHTYLSSKVLSNHWTLAVISAF